MERLLVFLTVLSFLASPVFAGSPSAWDRAGSALARTPGFAPGAITTLDPGQRTILPRSVPVGVDAGVVPPGLWNALAPTDAASLAWLAGRIPGLDTKTVRTLTAQAADAMLADCAARKLTPLEFFTDAAFRGQNYFYFSQDLLEGMYARYDFRVVTPVGGKDEKGVPFVMQGMVVGADKLEILYDRDNITFLHRDFDNGKYTVKARVVERILGPGDLGIKGVVVHVGIFKPEIQRIVKVSPTEGRVETSLGSRIKAATPVRLR